MRTLLIAGAAALMLGGCGRSTDAATSAAAANTAKPVKKRPAYCFFKDEEMKGWAASRGKDGNIKVKGKVYREDSRYQGILGPPEVVGTVVSIAPTLTVNTGAYGAPGDWWDVTTTIPNSASIDTVNVNCGAKTIASLKVATKA